MKITTNKLILQLKRWLSYIWEVEIDTVHTPVTPVIKVKASGGKFVMDAEHVNYAYGGMEVFFKLAFDQLSIPEKGTKRALILGHGAGNIAHMLENSTFPPDEIIGVELDKAMKKLSESYFKTEKLKKTTVVYEDAADFADNCKNTFDLIIIDIFVDDQVPEKFITTEFLQKTDQLLNANGVLFFNRLAHTERHKKESEVFYDKFQKTLKNTTSISVYGNIACYYKKPENA